MRCAAGELPRRDFAQEIERLGEDDLEAAARAHALECHLMNTAEERERLRALRARGEQPDGVAAAVDELIDARVSRARAARAVRPRARDAGDHRAPDRVAAAHRRSIT